MGNDLQALTVEFGLLVALLIMLVALFGGLFSNGR